MALWEQRPRMSVAAGGGCQLPCNRCPGQDDLRERESPSSPGRKEEAAQAGSGQAARGDSRGEMRWHPGESWEVWVLF